MLVQCASTHFWNYTTCVPKFLNGSSCIHNIQCDTDKFLSCDSSNGQCLCNSVSYWDSSASPPICTAKLPLNTACTETYQCRDYLGLECSTTCRCPADYYWDNTRCCKENFTPQLSYYESCTNSGHEPCLLSKGLQCSTGRCRCSDIQKYWNYIECVFFSTKKFFNITRVIGKFKAYPKNAIFNISTLEIEQLCKFIYLLENQPPTLFLRLIFSRYIIKIYVKILSCN
ncbi:hypothetical protein BpHYR1_002859 [Brachionus plicatilis]|uniref:EB domain-containing protein n=1 Tax=Brachionus plicatilis TaxID=10195 RepID=A0A3M7PE20_BRAPC|nr:hypothetical protein BpHYR1_002859 [Brachionus plicatilis]